MSSDIAIWPLKWFNSDGTENTNATMRILCVEDDYDAGKLDLQNGGVHTKTITNYAMSTGSIVTRNWSVDAYGVDCSVWPFCTYDNDDIYGESGIDENNRDKTVQRYNNTGTIVSNITDPNYVYIDLPDVNWFVGVRSY